MPEKIGFVGLGIIRLMAINLSRPATKTHGYDLFPWSGSAGGGGGCQLASDAAKKGDIIGHDGQTARRRKRPSWERRAAGAAAGKLIIDMSSIAPSVSQRTGWAVRPRASGSWTVPCRVAAGGDQRKGWVIMVGGDAKDFERGTGLREARNRRCCAGRWGPGQAVKLANQIIVGANIHAGRGDGVAAKSGVNRTWRRLGGLAGSNVSDQVAHDVQPEFPAGLRIELHYKDINNASGRRGNRTSRCR